MHCTRQCTHQYITDELFELAEYEMAKLKAQKGENNPTTVNITNNHDLIGSLAQNAVFTYIENMGIYVETTPYYDPRRNADKCDLYHRGQFVDIKGSSIYKYPHVTRYTKHLVYDHQKDKPMDEYLFCKVDIDNRLVHIAGLVSYEEAWQDKYRYMVKGKHPAHQIPQPVLKPFREWLLGV